MTDPSTTADRRYDGPVCDPHQHFWDLSGNTHPWLASPHAGFRYGDYSAIRRTYLPNDYRTDTRRQNVVRSVHIEAEWDPADPVAETRWLDRLAQSTGWPTACVGQAWFARDDIAEVLAGHAASALVRGIRQKPPAAARPDEVDPRAPGAMGDERFRRGYDLMPRYGFSYDLQTPWWHLAEAADLARSFPETRIVLNHTGLPADRSEAGLAGWRRALETFAAEPNTRLKISGLGLADGSWPVDGNRVVVRDAIRIFGVRRCMFASNFPVDSLVADYDTIYDGFRAFVADLSDADQRALFHDNAVRCYRL